MSPLCSSVLQEIFGVASFNSLMLLLINFNQSKIGYFQIYIMSWAKLVIRRSIKCADLSSHSPPNQVHFVVQCNLLFSMFDSYIPASSVFYQSFQFFIFAVEQKIFRQFFFYFDELYCRCFVSSVVWLEVFLCPDRSNDNWLIKYEMPDIDENDQDVSW